MRSEQRQLQILECAKNVFAEHGYHAAKISHICAEAGIGRGTLYQYFRNKQSVFAAILRQTLERIQQLMEGRRLQNLPRPEHLHRSAVIAWSAGRLETLFNVVFQDERTLRIILREAVGLDVDIETLLREIDDTLISILESDLRQAQRAGILRDLDPRIAATLMVGGIEKLVLIMLRRDAAVDLSALAKQTASLHCSGLLSTELRDA